MKQIFLLKMTCINESLEISKNIIKCTILENIMTFISDKLLQQNLNKNISVFGVQQTTNKLLPKIIESSTLTLQKDGRTLFHEDQAPQNSIIKQKQKFAKSYYQINSNESANDFKNLETQTSWLESYRQSKILKQQFQRVHAINSCPVSNEMQNQSNKYTVISNKNKIINQGKYFSVHLNQNQQSKQNLRSKQKLIKLDLGDQKQDDFIIRKRQNLLRKKIIQKKLKTLSDTEQILTTQLLTKNQEKKLISTNFHSFTTDYNGQLIKFKNSIQQSKTKLKKQNLSKGNFVKRQYASIVNSPQKVEQFNKSSDKFNKKVAEIQDESILKEKINMKVKIKTLIQHISTKPTRPINFQIIQNKRFNSIQRNSSDDFEMNEKIQKVRSMHGLKTLKFLHQPLDPHSIIRSIELSPGVTLGNSAQFSNDKQNNTFPQIQTIKSIGKSLGKSTNSFNFDRHSGTLKSIMVSKKYLKNQSKLKKTHQKHAKFVQIHNQFN